MLFFFCVFAPLRESAFPMTRQSAFTTSKILRKGAKTRRVCSSLLTLCCLVLLMASLGSEQIAVTTGKAATPIQFVDVTAAAGIKWSIKTLVPGPKYLIETMGGGGGFIDYNGEGLIDSNLVCNLENPQPAGSSA